ncbi:MAG: tetratricopeptide repeat protein [Fimbriimonadaceae bacterium]
MVQANNGNQPFNPIPPGTTISPRLPQPGQNNGGGGNAGGLPPANGGNTDPAPNGQLNTPPANNQERDPGVIDIKVHPGSGNTIPVPDNGDEEPDADLSVTALIRKARNQYVTGDYSGAAAAYLEALRRGASPSSTNQRLAQCYEKLGKKNEAIAAYKRAMASMELL